MGGRWSSLALKDSRCIPAVCVGETIPGHRLTVAPGEGK